MGQDWRCGIAARAIAARAIAATTTATAASTTAANGTTAGGGTATDAAVALILAAASGNGHRQDARDLLRPLAEQLGRKREGPGLQLTSMRHDLLGCAKDVLDEFPATRTAFERLGFRDFYVRGHLGLHFGLHIPASIH
jgi:hypothetical protein